MPLADPEHLPFDAAAAAPWSGEFPVLAAGAVIERTRTGVLIDLLRIKLGFPPEVFARAVRPVIEGYAELVQLLPVTESRHHARPGGRFICALEVALRALDHRRGQILPRGAAPEAIGAQAHRWTYAVFVAALLHGAGGTAAGLCVRMRVGERDPRPWDPLAGSMRAQGASSYCVEFAGGDAEPDEGHRELPNRLFMSCVPAPIREWLSEDAGLMAELQAWLSGDGHESSGAIAELVLRAALGTSGTGRAIPAEPVTDALSRPSCRVIDPAAGSAAQFGGSPPTSAPERVEQVQTEVARTFVGWLKSGIADGTIRINEPNALVHGVAEGMLLVSPRIFREFIRWRAKGGQEGGTSSDGTDDAKRVQRQVLRAGWHLRGDKGATMITYHATQPGRPARQITGLVISGPERLGIDPLPVNPALARVRGTGETT